MSVDSKRRPKSESQRALDFIKSRILAGDFPPGMLLAEQVLSDEMQLSRTPVREALKTLESQRFVRIDVGRGARVSQLGAPEVRELFQLREALERYAIERALTAIPAPSLTPIATILDEQQKALADDNPSLFVDLDREFHMGILDLVGNRRICGILDDVWDHVSVYSHGVIRREPRQSRSLEEHRRILVAMQEGDWLAATGASSDHLERSVRRILLG